MDGSEIVSSEQERLIDICHCEKCNSEMQVEDTHVQAGSLYVWYICDCGERFLKKHENHPLSDIESMEI